MKNIAIFASGNGTNCENIIRYFASSEDIKTSLVVTNNPNAKVIERSERLGIPVRVMTKAEINDRETMLRTLADNGIDMIVLAGFLLFIPAFLVDAYKDRIANIHPSLLPEYGGKGMYGMRVHEAVKQNNEPLSGITIHYVSNEYDRGRIIAQYSTPLLPTDSAEDIAEKVHELEYKHYPQVLEKLIEGTVR